MAFGRANLAASLPTLVIGGMVAIALVGAVAGSLGQHTGDPPIGQAVASRDLQFEDRADGAILIFDAGSASPFQVMQGENGFLRGALRGLTRIRRSEGLDKSKPFHLAAWPDGRLTLEDLATGQRLDLEAFGHTNEAVFARMLPGLPGVGGGA